MVIKGILLSSLTVVLFACSELEENINEPGICISFDDRNIVEWYSLRDLLSENGVQVTFFITQPGQLNQQEIRMLHVLKKDGHEIGFHGNIHVLSESYIREKSYSSYLEKEIDQGIKIMDSLGFQCKSFAYPYGSKYWFTDFILSTRFEILRGVQPLGSLEITELDDAYYQFENKGNVSAISFDISAGLNNMLLDKAIERAKMNREVLILYAHKPSMSLNERYTFRIETLKSIISKAKKQNFKFYRMNDLISH